MMTPFWRRFFHQRELHFHRKQGLNMHYIVWGDRLDNAKCDEDRCERMTWREFLDQAIEEARRQAC